MTCKFLIAALALSACVDSATAAPLQRAVTYSDLDVSHPAGAQVLLARINAAARVVCGGAADLRNIAAHRQEVSCVKDKTETAIRSVHAPLVAKLYGAPQLYVGDSRFDVAAK